MGSQTPLEELTPDVPVEEGKGTKTRGESDSAKRRRKASTARSENELRSRIMACLERVAVAVETRGDEELADIIREDSEIMSVGLVSLTRPVAALRAPLVIALAVIEPVMAFGRLFRAVAERAALRRIMRAEEQEAAARAAQEAEQGIA